MAGSTQWRPARAIVTLRDQLNAKYPNRSKASDGTIGDAAHQAVASDHNPNTAGVVTAFDITHDPANGLDIAKLATQLVSSGDSRIKYVIANSKIWVDGKWSAYSGTSDPHTNHLHLSVSAISNKYDDPALWALEGEQMIENTDNEYGRAADLHWRVRGTPLSREGFARDVAGRTWLKFIETISDSPEASAAQHAQNVGVIALRDDWNGKMQSLLAQAEVLAKNPTRPEFDALQSQLKACAIDFNISQEKLQELQNVQDQDRAAGDSLLRRLGQLIKRYLP